MWNLKRKKNLKLGLTREDVREVVREELSLSEDNRKKIADDEKKKQAKIRAINVLPPHKRLKLLRFLKERGEKHGEK